MTEQERNKVVERARLALANANGVPNPNWDESKHPRGAGGRFGRGSGAPTKEVAKKKKDATKAEYAYISNREQKELNGPKRVELEEKGRALVKKVSKALPYYENYADGDEEGEEAYTDFTESVADDFEDWALEVIADYPLPIRIGMKRDKALAERKALVRKVGEDIGFFGPKDGDGWLGLNKAVRRELGW